MQMAGRRAFACRMAPRQRESPAQSDLPSLGLAGGEGARQITQSVAREARLHPSSSLPDNMRAETLGTPGSHPTATLSPIERPAAEHSHGENAKASWLWHDLGEV